jgi:hypothetical protein
MLCSPGPATPTAIASPWPPLPCIVMRLGAQGSRGCRAAATLERSGVGAALRAPPAWPDRPGCALRGPIPPPPQPWRSGYASGIDVSSGSVPAPTCGARASRWESVQPHRGRPGRTLNTRLALRNPPARPPAAAPAWVSSRTSRAERARTPLESRVLTSGSPSPPPPCSRLPPSPKLRVTSRCSLLPCSAGLSRPEPACAGVRRRPCQGRAA